MKFYDSKNSGSITPAELLSFIKDKLLLSGWVVNSDTETSITLTSLRNTAVTLSEVVTGTNTANFELVLTLASGKQFPVFDIPKFTNFSFHIQDWAFLCNHESFYLISLAGVTYVGPFVTKNPLLKESHLVLSNGPPFQNQGVSPFIPGYSSVRMLVCDTSAEGIPWVTGCYLKQDPRHSQRNDNSSAMGIFDYYQIWIIQSNEMLCGVLPNMYTIGDSSLDDNQIISLSSGKKILVKTFWTKKLGFEIDG